MTTAQTPNSHGWPRMFLERLQPLVSGNPTHVPSLTVVCGVYLDSPLPPELAAESGRSVPRTRLITHAIKITPKDFEIPCHTPADAPGTDPERHAAPLPAQAAIQEGSADAFPS